jgi:hypothetical protein
MSAEEEKKKDPEPLYYMENGLIVFTAAYHLKRGYCCKRGCRHCPYGFKKEGNSKLERG